ncbi:MAG: hypothetical protein J5793_05080, partial [Clostridia bacterium]|nr:hypothetical protein [Clostridia bacterium]
MKKAVKIRALKLLVTGVFVGALILTLAVIAGQTPTLAAPATTISINNSADLIAYSREYANGQHNPQDTLSLALSTGSMYVLPENGGSGYISIGSDSRPFDGQILIADSASATFLLDTPLFGTMTTNVTIGNGSGSVRQVEIMRSSDVDDVPLFAQKVVAVSGASDAVWSVKLNPDDSDSDNITAFKFAGVVGEIGDGCSVSLAFEHNSVTENAQGASVTANVTASGDVGILCGTLGEGSTLIADVTLGSDMAGKTFNVTSVSGNAGGVVGYMKDGSSVVMKNGFASFFNVTADAGFAGGIAGYAENADISVDTAPSGYFTVTKAISGADGAGALYGYYESTKNNAGASGGTRTFDLKNLRTDEDIAISAGSSSAAGGVIGRLYAENSITVTDGSVSDVGSVSAYDRTVKFTGGKYRGGVIGSYANTSLDNVLEILNVPVKIAGNSGSNTESAGAIGEISDADGTSAAYVKINGLRVENSGTISAGAVGKMGSKGSFVDFTGRYKGKGTRVAGLVDDMGCGVIRISGVTDLSETTSNTAQLVNKRGNGLIYALGSGAD